MRLTSLEIKGFKSFGDRVIIHFDKGTTSIVGPNGSGKSNVVDAIRWVLGEQKTRMLRSEKMENIIFNGTKTRKPANLAEVTLTFENTKNILPTEYSTVSISRKLFRSGESEYYLNGVHCRLKDVTDLFMDTGIGPDSYSIIELKMVDEILNDKNSTIKILLEEAAGISKYKIRKRQTFQKLEETEADLNRVNDLLFEIEKSMKQLEAQAKKTARYYRLKDELKSSSTIVAIHSVKSFKDLLSELEKKEQLLKDDKIGIHTKASTLEAALEKIKAECLDKEKALSAAQKQLNEQLMHISKLENEEKAKRDKLQFLSEKEKQIIAQDEKDTSTIDELNTTIEFLTAEKLGEQAKLDLLSMQLTELKENVEQNKKAFELSLIEISELNKQLHNVRQDLNDYETRIAVNQTKTASLNEEISRIKIQSAESAEKISTIESELLTILPLKESSERELNQLKERKVFVDDKIKTEENIQLELKNKIAEETRRADARTNEYELTKNLVEQMDGYPESIKYLKKSNSRYRSTPLVSEIVSCNERYKVAIENYLEPFLNHFVVASKDEAWEALNMLNHSAQGRANFFVLDSLNHFDTITHENIDGCTAVIDLIEYESKYSKLFELLLGHVYIINDDVRFADFDNHSLKNFVLLSQNGNFLKQKYSLGGGSVGLFDGKRTGKIQNLEKLVSQIESHKLEVEILNESLSKNSMLLWELKEEAQKLNREISEKEKLFHSVNSSYTSAQNNKGFLLAGIESFSRSVFNLEEQLHALASGLDIEQFKNINIENLRNNLEALSNQHTLKQEESNNLQQQYNEKSAAYNQQNISLLQLQNKIQNVTRDIGYKSAQIETITQGKNNNAIELELTKSQLAELNSLLETSSVELQAIIQDKTAFETTLNEQENDYYKTKGDIDREEKAINELRKQREQADVIIQSIHEEVTEVKMKLNSIKERIQIEFNITIDEKEEPVAEEGFNLDELKQRTEKLKLQIEQFGPINPLALESFNEVKERHDFIVKEKDDLHNAKLSLLQTIAEIDQTAREKFMDAYEKIRGNFISVFRSLFSEEDNCDLVLLDLTNPLESDIQIVAQPKGKKPLSIHQLSGGEKTLTATALLFGIYLLKPSPFCIFDEVDAPLDDANIDKFNKIIRKFSNDSQFIIITHNKRTMAATDIMYGITMAEMGVTNVVPVDLKVYAEV